MTWDRNEKFGDGIVSLIDFSIEVDELGSPDSNYVR
ncbi:hypothetical protein [Picosynechococcus sp. PCC 7117]